MKTNKKIEKRKICRVDIGCGKNKQGPDWFGIDYRKLEGVDLVQDLEKFPWKIPEETFTVAVASHVIEHINPAKGIFINFLNEVWRILKPGGEFIISCPYATSPGMLRDPSHCNFVTEETFAYADPHDPFYNGQLYHIYSILPWQIKPNTLSWHDNGNLEVVLVKRPLREEYGISKETLKPLKNKKMSKMVLGVEKETKSSPSASQVVLKGIKKASKKNTNEKI